MSVRNVCLATVVAILVGVSGAWGQNPATETPSGSINPAGPGMAGPGTSGGGTGGAPYPATTEGNPSDAGTNGTAGTEAGGQPGPNSVTPPGQLSNYIMGGRQCCCGPVGGNGPVQMEIFFRAGPSFIIGGGIFNHILEDGWEVEGGGRSLFFDVDRQAAWTIDLSLANIRNEGQHADRGIYLRNILLPVNPTTNRQGVQTTNSFARVDFVPGQPRPVLANPGEVAAGSATNPATPRFEDPGVTLSMLNRTEAKFGGGREWYLYGPANWSGDCCPGGCGSCNMTPMWRAGFDVGGIWGTERASFHELRHRSAVNGGFFAAVHSDVDVPCGCCCIFHAGVRLEWEYIDSQVLQEQNNAATEDINLAFEVGVRY